MVPLLGDGMSVTTLSVSISTNGSPDFTCWPLVTCHSAMIPSSKPSPISGKLKIYLMSKWLKSNSSFNFVENLLGRLHVEMLAFG